MNYESEIIIEKRKIGLDQPTYFIADIAANHDGDLDKAKELIWMAKESGADVAKFQHFKAETIVSDYGFKNLRDTQAHQKNWNKSVFDVYKFASVSLDWTLELKETADKAGITFFTSPYDISILNQIDPYVAAHKIGSGDITWHEIILEIAKKNKPYILATGASNIQEVIDVVEIVSKINKQIILLQCNTNYTASIDNFKYINLNVLKTFNLLFPNMIVGLSDHTPGHSTVLGAVALGARVIEKHFTDDNNREGPDHLFSLNPKTWAEMVNRTRELESALGSTVKKVEYNEKETVIVQRRCVRAKHDILADQKITLEDVICLRPSPKNSVPPFQIKNILGKRSKRKIRKGEHFTIDDL